jgi:hypothetical protein
MNLILVWDHWFYQNNQVIGCHKTQYDGTVSVPRWKESLHQIRFNFIMRQNVQAQRLD